MEKGSRGRGKGQKSSRPHAPSPQFFKSSLLKLKMKGVRGIRKLKAEESDEESYIELAIDVLKTKDRASIKFLKDFLNVLPSPGAVEEVLVAAIYQLAEIDSDDCCWILYNRDYLMPELDLVAFATNLALSKLENRGFIPDRDFRVEANGQLYVKEKTKSQLLVGNSIGEQLILEEFIRICD